MKLNRVFLSATVAAISAVAISSCAYDPYYSGSSYSSGYRSGYGNGYYPVGYRPSCVQTAPHPYGWKSGSKYIAPPSQIRDCKLNTYQNRDDRYRSLNNNWSRNLQVNTQTRQADSYRDRHTSSYRIPETRNQPSFGSSQVDQRSSTSDRSRDTYIKESQNSRSSEPRVAELKQEEPRSSKQYHHERNTSRLGRTEEFNQGRSGRSNESVKLEVMRPSEKRDGHRAKLSESNDERISKRR